MLLIAEGMWLRTGNVVYRQLAKSWGKAFAVTFIVGAVSGTMLSFELGLLWPRFMAFAGGIIGMPFSLEGFAFFIEAIFLGLYLYGWDRLPARAHFLCAIPIFVGGIMQIPGFDLEGSFLFVNNPSEIRVTVDATFKAFDALFLGVNGTVAIIKGSNPGLVINIDAYLKSGFFGIDGIFDLNATFNMKVNTRSGSGSDSFDYGVMRGYTRIAFSGSMKLMSVIDLNVSGYIEAYLGMFRAEINGSADREVVLVEVTRCTREFAASDDHLSGKVHRWEPTLQITEGEVAIEANDPGKVDVGLQ